MLEPVPEPNHKSFETFPMLKDWLLPTATPPNCSIQESLAVLVLLVNTHWG